MQKFLKELNKREMCELLNKNHNKKKCIRLYEDNDLNFGIDTKLEHQIFFSNKYECFSSQNRLNIQVLSITRQK
ncbi:UNKNOWN [Stylonychia lemnae]|uniref:Uncharacterized protein n=1 Tax=Stylonychia lemnae TaxID=5949 RepID=A0A077ZQV0_STYLE|nr:UNKNOWN [Stylonychia lemnae]|eukprot:CDW71765.1 UNKNOWN [Stylonychia lemnae]